MPLSKPRYLYKYNNKIRRKFITYAIYPFIRVGDYQESIVLILIIDLGN